MIIPTGPYTDYSKVGYYEAKLEGVGHSFISQMMQVMLDAHAPEQWVFAHFHTSKIFKLEQYPTCFQVVGINEVVEVPFNFETEDKVLVNTYGSRVGEHVHAFIAGQGNNCFVCGQEVQP